MMLDIVYIGKEIFHCANEYSFISFMNTDNLDDNVKFTNIISCEFEIRKQLYETLQP